jgi:hypothetical protein
MNEVRDVTVDPKRASTVWATTYGFVYKSPDGGRTWPSGVGGCTAHACQLGGTMGAAGPRFPQIAVSTRTPRIVYLGAGGGINRSPDGGRTWTGRRLPAEFTAFTFDPLAADSLFVATNRGVYMRANNGGGWRAIGRRTKAFSLAIDSEGTTLYVETRHGSTRTSCSSSHVRVRGEAANRRQVATPGRGVSRRCSRSRIERELGAL